MGDVGCLEFCPLPWRKDPKDEVEREDGEPNESDTDRGTTRSREGVKHTRERKSQ